MKKFIIKTLLLIFPFIISGYVYKFSYYSEMGDLSRLGHLNLNYKKYNLPFSFYLDSIYFDYLHNTKNLRYKVLNIGDSFSRQEIKGINGYTNYLAMTDTISLLNHSTTNPVQRLKEILNSNVLDSIEVEYIILQSVERHFINRLIDVELLKKINYIELKEIDKKEHEIFKNDNKIAKNYPGFFSKGTLFFSLNKIFNKDLKGIVYPSRTKDNLFSLNRNTLLFYHDDISNLEINNNLTLIEKANEELNSIALKLKQKNIKLIVLISPDKYSFYYNDLLDNNYPEPILFDILDTLSKDYLYFNSKKLLSEHKQTTKDLYFFDDTHWSPLASKIITDKLREIILE